MKGLALLILCLTAGCVSTPPTFSPGLTEQLQTARLQPRKPTSAIGQKILSLKTPMRAPTVLPTVLPAVVVPTPTNYLVVRFRYDDGGTNLNWFVQSSPDLRSWSVTTDYVLWYSGTNWTEILVKKDKPQMFYRITK